MFYIIGLGLGDPEDITVKGLNIIKQCERVYLESYTSILSCGQEKLEEFYGRKLILADREMVEQRADEILEGATSQSIAFLVVGDPLGATTHTDLMLRAKEQGIATSIVHNASIMNAVGCCGLQLYHFGETVSIPYWDDSWKPDSFYDKIVANLKHGLHTLCLLDIKVKEPTLESLMKKKREYMPPRFMSVREAASQLLEIVANKSKEVAGDVGPDEHKLQENSLVVGLARVGHESQKIVACTLREMQQMDLGPPLHSLIIPNSQLHELEKEFLQKFAALDQQLL
ncbi:diphthine methyl ester synthase [Anopheles maculipalpis]|uniref:diphthine methyl ester synthase n=1 Tax=Anopheles maculipalpis TaxID=1496333 RepID=UPI00215963C5|nr:diphthine methyl ester synthase [Anopheles maculipalpis]